MTSKWITETLRAFLFLADFIDILMTNALSFTHTSNCDLRCINRILVCSNHAVRRAIYNSQSGTRRGTISTLSMGIGGGRGRQEDLLCENGRNRSSTQSITTPVTTEIPLIALRGTRRVESSRALKLCSATVTRRR